MLQKAKITLATGDSFIDGEDRLRFVGKFIPVGEAHQFVRHPSGDTPRASKSYAASSGTWTRGKTIFQVNLMTADNSDTPLVAGQLYAIEGEIKGVNFMRVPKLTWTPGDQRNSNLERHHTEWRRVQVSGVGTVVKIKSKPSWPDTSVILADITVEHTGELSNNGVFRVRCILGLASDDFPKGLNLFNRSKIAYKGSLEGFGNRSCRMIVEVTQVTVSSEDLLDNDSDGTSSSLNVDF